MAFLFDGAVLLCSLRGRTCCHPLLSGTVFLLVRNQVLASLVLWNLREGGLVAVRTTTTLVIVRNLSWPVAADNIPALQKIKCGLQVSNRIYKARAGGLHV